MIAWEVLLAGLAFVLIGGLLALRATETLSGASADAASGGAEATGSPPPGDGGVESPEAIPDEERVLAMLSDHDGRLRQQAIVDRTDWSKSKVSRLLSKMEKRGTIRKVPIGRENVIELADEDEPVERSAGENGAG